MHSKTSYSEITSSHMLCIQDYIPMTLHNASLMMKENMRELSTSILNSSTNISNSLQAIANEIERSKKLDEYHALLKHIEKYEKRLFKAGVIKKAYEEMSFEYTPLISTNERSIFITLQYFKDICMLKKLISTYKVCPTKIIRHCIISGKYTLTFYATTSLPNGNCLGSVFSYKDNNAAYIGDAKFNYEDGMLLPQSAENADLLIRTWQNSLERDTIIENIDSILEFKQFIDTINLDIILDNLRGLSLALWNAVRQYEYNIPPVNS